MGKRKDYKLFYIFILIFLASEASFGEIKPDCVDGNSAFYPKGRYLTGIGYGSTRETAEKNAYGAISKILSAKITSMSKD